MNDVRSKIVIMPNSEDLFSLRNRRLITRGPAGPIRLELDEIYTLLNQPNRPAVFEVVVLRVDKYPTPKKIYSDPVRLTLQNYDLSYEEIAGVDLKRLKTATERVTQVSTKATLVTTEETQPAKVEPVVEEVRGTTPYNKPTLTEVTEEEYVAKVEEFSQEETPEPVEEFKEEPMARGNMADSIIILEEVEETTEEVLEESTEEFTEEETEEDDESTEESTEGDKPAPTNKKSSKKRKK